MAKLDLTQFKRPADAAKALHKYLVEKATAGGQQESEVVLLTPERSNTLGYGKAWRVMWEAGPFQWAVRVSLGGTIHDPDDMRALAAEFGFEFKPSDEPEIKLDSKRWTAEPYYSFDLGFYPN